MNIFTTSRGTRAQHVAPRYQSAPYRQTHGRRDYIHGRIQPMDNPYTSPAWYEIVALVLVAAFMGALLATGGM